MTDDHRPEDEDFDVERAPCLLCDGEGEVVTCIDDLCHNGDGCIHGDGYGVCPDCKGKGWLGEDDHASVG